MQRCWGFGEEMEEIAVLPLVERPISPDSWAETPTPPPLHPPPTLSRETGFPTYIVGAVPALRTM